MPKIKLRAVYTLLLFASLATAAKAVDSKASTTLFPSKTLYPAEQVIKSGKPNLLVFPDVLPFLSVDVGSDPMPGYGERALPGEKAFEQKTKPRFIIVPEVHRGCAKCNARKDAVIAALKNGELFYARESYMEALVGPELRHQNLLGLEDQYPFVLSLMTLSMHALAAFPAAKPETVDDYQMFLIEGLFAGIKTPLGTLAWKQSARAAFLEDANLSRSHREAMVKVLDSLLADPKKNAPQSEFRHFAAQEISPEILTLEPKLLPELSLHFANALLEMSKEKPYSNYEVDTAKVNKLLVPGKDLQNRVMAEMALEFRERWMFRNAVVAYSKACAANRDLILIVGAAHATRLIFRLNRYFEQKEIKGVPLFMDASHLLEHMKKPTPGAR